MGLGQISAFYNNNTLHFSYFCIVGAGSERDPAATQPGGIYSPVRTPPIPATNPPFPSARPPVFVSIANLFKNGHASEHPPKFNA